jgi:SAM-dependent methyltransferase
VNDLESVTKENRRLHHEVVRLRDRVASFERSRWWRLHPRLLARRARVALARSQAQSLEALEPTGPAKVGADPLWERFNGEVIERGTFSVKWFAPNVRRWEPIISGHEGLSRILEIGSFEGLSACYFLWRLPDSTVTCIDTFTGSPEDAVYGYGGEDLEAVFDRNVALLDATRVRKLKGPSRARLSELLDEESTFDLVYVDGSHLALDVLVDAALSWQVLAPGGVLIFDDYDWAMLGDDRLLRPGPAVDAFLELVKEHALVLQRRGQVIVRKT